MPDSWRSAVLDSRGNLVARSHEMARYVAKPAVPELVQAVSLNKEGAPFDRSDQRQDDVPGTDTMHMAE